jgi:lipopolysaccharide heptosyltransferase II
LLITKFQISTHVGLSDMRFFTSVANTGTVDSLMIFLARVQVMLAKTICRVPEAPRQMDPARPNNILVIQLYDTVGDVVCTSPLIRELAQNFPGSALTVAVSAHGVASLLDENPYISDTIPVNVSCAKWLRPLLLPWRHWWLARKVFKQRHFDVVIIPRYSVDSSYATFLAYFSGVPCRIGYTEKTSVRKSVLNRNWDQLLTIALPAFKELTNEVLLNLNVLSAFSKSAKDNRTEVWITGEDRQFASAAVEHLGNKRVCLSPTSGHSVLKQWGVNRFAELAVELVRCHCDIVLVGGPGDKLLGASIEQRLNGLCVNLVGKTSIREMAAVISKCNVYVGNDAGPGHVASAMNVPTVSIFGSSCHHQFAPWGQHNHVLTVNLDCSPCGTGHLIDRCVRCIYNEPKCLEAITVEEVLATVLSAIESPGASEWPNNNRSFSVE